MKDGNGLYYYPFPQNKRVRMYVRAKFNDIEFRMWNQDDPQMWDAHDWVPYAAIEQATSMYTGGSFDPGKAYDLTTARALIEDDE
jgi:hypothetical protein